MTRPRIGLHALGIGPGARPGVITAVARAAEAAGFATLWVGEHVVMVDQGSSRYPYNDAGAIPVPADADWLDPLVCLGFAASATDTIRLSTGVLLLPEHNPVVVAKQAATLDVLSGGRFTLGVGIGWSRDEFAALGVPFQDRARRTVEYVRAMRELWREDRASFSGEFVSFESIRVYPKPVRNRRLPVFFGGNSDPALERVAAHADGWYGFNLRGVDGVRDCVAGLKERCAADGRELDAIELAVSVEGCDPSDLPELGRIGIDELVLVEAPPSDAEAASGWVQSLAGRWLKA
jgi:probable F420-dependent oxidoreductase